jgi:hypothetical protein
VASPQPEPNEQLPPGGTAPSTGSFVDCSPAGHSPDVVWLTVCGWCERVKVGARWLEAERALAQFELSPGHEPSLTHGICPSCFAGALKDSGRARTEAV